MGDGSARTAKAPGALRTISEVSDEVAVPQHILLFWETRFPELRPLKRGGNRRYYRPDDVALCRALKRLLHEEGMTVRGVRKQIADHGVKKLVAGGAVTAAEPQVTEGAGAPTAGTPAGTISPDLVARLMAVRASLARALEPVA